MVDEARVARSAEAALETSLIVLAASLTMSCEKPGLDQRVVVLTSIIKHNVNVGGYLKSCEQDVDASAAIGTYHLTSWPLNVERVGPASQFIDPVGCRTCTVFSLVINAGMRKE